MPYLSTLLDHRQTVQRLAPHLSLEQQLAQIEEKFVVLLHI